MSKIFTEISVKVYLLRSEEGGRKTPISTGYRPAVYFGNRQTDGMIQFSDQEKPVLGGEYTATIVLTHPEYLEDMLKKGAVFTFKEGSEIVAQGSVIEVKAPKNSVLHSLHHPS